jgi:hypothetical protein
MKKILIISTTIILFSNCVTESKMYPRQYSIKNESSQNVKLKFYLTFTNVELIDEVAIFNNESFKSELIEFSKPHSVDENYLINTAFKGSDSLVIIYDNSKRSIYSVDFYGNFSEPIDRNLFRFGNYEDLGNDEFQFTITQEDYNNAEDCNGNCD